MLRFNIFAGNRNTYLTDLQSYTRVGSLKTHNIAANNKSLNHNSRDDVIRISPKRFDDAYIYDII